MIIKDPYTYASMRAMEGRINWHINDLCNFKCEYCFFPYFVKENPDVGKLNPVEILNAFNKTGRQWHIYIAGGEPMLYPNFIELVNVVKPHHPIMISTNLYSKNVKAFAEQVSPDNIIVINASLHIGHHTETSLLKFIDNYHLFHSKGFNIIVTYVTYPPLFERLEKDFEFLKSKGIEQVHPLTFQGIFEDKKYPESYTHEQIKIIEKLSVEKMELFTTLDKMNFKNKPCRAGKDYFFMDIHGEMYKCGTILEESYGNLFKGTFSPGEFSLPCPVSRCNDSCHGVTSLVEKPEIPKLNSELKHTVLKNYHYFKEILSR